MEVDDLYSILFHLIHILCPTYSGGMEWKNHPPIIKSQPFNFSLNKFYFIFSLCKIHKPGVFSCCRVMGLKAHYFC
jgi:hypothetical protein